MKKSYYLVLSAFIIVLLICSCKKEWLDIKPDIALANPSTLEDYQALLDYSQINRSGIPSLGDFASDGYTVNETNFNTASPEFRNASTWSHNQPYRSSTTGWAPIYANIFYCNTVLDGLNLISPKNITDQKKYNQVKADALFLRSFYFWGLSQIWALPYQQSSANSDISIPLRLEADVNIPSVRSTVKETYDQVTNDLLLAKTLLTSETVNSPITYKTRVSKPAIFALLARVYLSMSDYQKAEAYADSCLNLYNKLIDYNPYPASGFPFPLFNDEVLFHCINISLIANTRAFIDPTLYATYDLNDKRRSLFFQMSSGNIIFRGNYTKSANNQIGLTTSEVYLIRAECRARNNKKDAALNDLNELLAKRWVTNTFVPLTAPSPEATLAIILKERRKELLFRGARWTDLRRLNLEPQHAITITRTIGSTTHTLQANSYNYTFPLPDDVIAEAKLPQNPGW